MKSFLFLSLLIPSIAFGQVKFEDLIKRNGLSYEKGANVPFTGNAFQYFPDGDIQTIAGYKDGLADGVIKSWYKKDALMVEGFYENGKKTGTWKLHFESGKLKKQGAYQNDLETGEETFWFENGNLSKKGSYVDGKLNGRYGWNYEDGQKRQEGFYINGQPDSTWQEWFENGQQKMQGQFTHAEKNGRWTWWDEKGNITTSKNYANGLLIVDKDNFDTYLEKFEYFLAKRDYKEALRNITSAKATITDTTEDNFIYMNLLVYNSRCYSSFSHYQQGERVLLDGIGLSETQSRIILHSHEENSPEKIKQVIKEITKKDKSKFQVGNHIALGLCHQLLGDSTRLRKEQQLSMDKGQWQDWILTISTELYRLASKRAYFYHSLEQTNDQLKTKGITEQLELTKAHFLTATEQFEEAQSIVDRYLKINDKNVPALLIKADIEMAYGNVDNIKIYQEKALAVDPNALDNKSE